MFIMSVVYAWYLVGPISLVGCVIILLFYPIMVRDKYWFRVDFILLKNLCPDIYYYKEWLCVLIFQGTIAFLTSLIRGKMAPITDKRVALMNELINSIQLVKMYAWEKPFFEKIQSVRKDELKLLRRSAFLQSISFSVTPTITIIAAVVTFFCLT